jgi:hypothetical protein
VQVTMCRVLQICTRHSFCVWAPLFVTARGGKAETAAQEASNACDLCIPHSFVCLT